MKKFWILPVTALMISCGAATEEAPAAEPVSYTHLTLPTKDSV